IALVFTLLGIWVASKILPNPHTNQYKLEHVVTPKGLSILSERELEVLKKMADGLSNQQIAESLFISLHTVKTHSTRIFEKLDVNRRTQAVLKAREKGILDEVISSKRV
ncbi:MAG: DNA-binding response regulator, partial [Saprospiraceae bacterium]|nr:DNA-binding response regulator [Saprospiraceae bacterium]